MVRYKAIYSDNVYQFTLFTWQSNTHSYTYSFAIRSFQDNIFIATCPFQGNMFRPCLLSHPCLSWGSQITQSYTYSIATFNLQWLIVCKPVLIMIIAKHCWLDVNNNQSISQPCPTNYGIRFKTLNKSPVIFKKRSSTNAQGMLKGLI